MNLPLSDAAQQVLDQRMGELAMSLPDGAWAEAYLALLKRLSERDTSDVTEWEIKGHGFERLEESREAHRVAIELKAYALHELGPDISAALVKLPESASLDEFLESAWRDTGRDVLRCRFMAFLTAEAEGKVDAQMELHPMPEVSIEERVRRLAESLFAIFDKNGMAAPTQHEYHQRFRTWWKSQASGNPLAGKNHADGVAVERRLTRLIQLLPSKQRFKGITKQQWRGLAENDGLVSSLRTFNRDVATLLDEKRIRVQEDGSFRQISK